MIRELSFNYSHILKLTYHKIVPSAPCVQLEAYQVTLYLQTKRCFNNFHKITLMSQTHGSQNLVYCELLSTTSDDITVLRSSSSASK